MKRRALKAKQDFSFWLSAKSRKYCSKINNSVKSALQKWIISHPHVIKSTIEYNYITVKLDDGYRPVNTEVRQKVFLQISFRELHKDMQKNMLLVFP